MTIEDYVLTFLGLIAVSGVLAVLILTYLMRGKR